MDKESKIFVAGHKGMVGSAIVRKLKKEGFFNILTANSSDLDLRNQEQVQSYFQTEKPDYVILAAAKVGGIVANNTFRAEFIYDNLMIQSNVIHQSYLCNVKKLLFLGSSCIYPKNAPQPLKEDFLLSGYLEKTNEPYAIAKIAGIKTCEAYRDQYNCNFISAMPTNLYGPNDNYDLQTSHVLPALIRKFHEAKLNNHSNVEIWGSGKPKREFLHVNDLADACFFLLNSYDEKEMVNIGTGQDITILELAELIKSVVGYTGSIVMDGTKPDGTMRKVLDVSKMEKLGWKSKISLKAGIESIYQEYKSNSDHAASTA